MQLLPYFAVYTTSVRNHLHTVWNISLSTIVINTALIAQM